MIGLSIPSSIFPSVSWSNGKSKRTGCSSRSHPQGKPTRVYNLDQTQFALLSSALIFLRTPEQVIAAAKDEILRSRNAAPRKVDTFNARMPANEIAQLGNDLFDLHPHGDSFGAAL